MSGRAPRKERGRRFFFSCCLAAVLVAFLPRSAAAVPIHDYHQITTLLRNISGASSASEVRRLLSEAAKQEHYLPADYPLHEGEKGIGVIWWDGGIPRCRVWLKNVDAGKLFRDILPSRYFAEGVTASGKIDIDAEILSGDAPQLRGTLRLRDLTVQWTRGKIALKGVEGTVPFRRFIGLARRNRPALQPRSVHVDHLVWAGRDLADSFEARAAYENRILRFEGMSFVAMSGSVIGSMVLDHRSAEWKTAVLLRLRGIDLSRLEELLPGLPILARFTDAHMDGKIGIAFLAPDRLQVTGRLESTDPGMIEISPRLKRLLEKRVASRSIPFSKLKISLEQRRSGPLQARIDLYHKTAQTIGELLSGERFAPGVTTIRFPLIPLIRELSR
ncbi:MAG: hypothetical protein D6679_13250 [Candidatus Hydrogenedentota bacterium]|nr:MAG: hypothetical protein D6679_13250 [Candidatus Hydrogenedentota bacterium]